MIKSTTMYAICCDGCGKEYEDGNGFSVWPDPSDVRQSANEKDWIQEDETGLDYCSDCWDLDDEDNIIIKKSAQ